MLLPTTPFKPIITGVQMMPLHEVKDKKGLPLRLGEHAALAITIEDIYLLMEYGKILVSSFYGRAEQGTL